MPPSAPLSGDLSRVRLAALDSEVSRLGFGCASLGSRISPQEGLRALAEAHDAGVTWFDVAPSYGDGQAERLLAAFLATGRSDAQICTKIGLGAGSRGRFGGVLRPLARSVLDRFPKLRPFAGGRGAATRVPLTAEAIRLSLERSLAILGVDHVDALAWHDPLPDDIERDELLRAFEGLRTAGKARSLVVAGDAETARRLLARTDTFQIVQVPNNPEAPGASVVARLASGGLITHSALGRAGLLPRIASRLVKDPDFAARASALGYAGAPESQAADLLIDFALSTNPHGVLLMSMFRPKHLQQSLDRSRRFLTPEVARGLNDLLACPARAEEAAG